MSRLSLAAIVCAFWAVACVGIAYAASVAISEALQQPSSDGADVRADGLKMLFHTGSVNR